MAYRRDLRESGRGERGVQARILGDLFKGERVPCFGFLRDDSGEEIDRVIVGEGGDILVVEMLVRGEVEAGTLSVERQQTDEFRAPAELIDDGSNSMKIASHASQTLGWQNGAARGQLSANAIHSSRCSSRRAGSSYRKRRVVRRDRRLWLIRRKVAHLSEASGSVR